MAHVQRCSILSAEVKVYANHNDKSGEGERLEIGSLVSLLNRATVVAVISFLNGSLLGL